MGWKERFYADIMAIHPEVTGSLNLVVVKLPNTDTIKFVVDCGLFQEKEHEELNEYFPFYAENVDFCLVTHNHVDHIGRLPLLVKKGFTGRIYATEQTSTIIGAALEDSCKVLKDVSKRKNKPKLYDEGDVSETLKHLKPCAYNQTISIGDYVKVTFFKNGHLVGAAVILVQISYPGQEDINILFTGDYNNKNMFFDVDPIPEWVRELPLTVIQESTYGYMDSTDMEEVFEENILNCVNNGGTVISPVFSLGRMQEILYVIKNLQKSGKLDKSVEIYADGKLGIRYTMRYIDGTLALKPETEDFLPDGVMFVDKTSREQVLESTNPKIVLTTSGMGSYGPAQLYIPEYISRKNCLIQFTGYTAEGTLGHRLKNTEKGESVEIGGLIVKKKADVEYTTEFSAHAKADEMIDFLKQFKNLKLILLNHGEREVKTKFANRILDEVEPKRIGILGREYFFRVNPYGLVKTFSSKFK